MNMYIYYNKRSVNMCIHCCIVFSSFFHFFQSLYIDLCKRVEGKKVILEYVMYSNITFFTLSHYTGIKYIHENQTLFS